MAVLTHDSTSLRHIAGQVQRAVLEAARYLDGAIKSGEKPQVHVKADQTLVMNLDIESQRRILEVLKGSFPIVAEEDETSHALISTGGSYFLVDPLDGTTSCKRFLGQQGGQVGYGPLAGFVKDNVLSAAAFYSIPHRKLFTAVKGEGAYVSTFDAAWRIEGDPQKLMPPPCTQLSSAGMLFFISHYGEARFVEFLKRENAIENIYRFGGFANDCTRIAQGFEQVQLQFNIKPWDFSAVLFAAESGSDVYCDPLTRRTPLNEWKIEKNNPVVVLPPGMRNEFFALLDRAK